MRMDIFENYEKLVKPTMPKPVVDTDLKEDELFEIEKETPQEQQPPTFSDFDENALIEKISSKILESLSKQNNDGGVNDER